MDERRFVVVDEDGDVLWDTFDAWPTTRELAERMVNPDLKERILECVDPAELERLRAEFERRQSVLEIITGSVCAALSRAGFDDADDPGEAIDIITEERDALRVELAQARAAYEAGYSRGHNDTVESQYVEPAVAADEYLASLRISNAAREAHD